MKLFSKDAKGSFGLLLTLFALAFYLYIALSIPRHAILNWFSTDDAFYYFKTAQNITSGHGISFDGIGLTNGYHPLWLLICIPIFTLARFNLFLPLRALILVAGILNLGSSWLLYRWLKTYLSQPIATLAALFWAFYPPLHLFTTQNGLETGLTVFTLILFLSTVSEERASPYKLGGLALLVLFARLDTLFILAATGFWLFTAPSPRRSQIFAWLWILPASIITAFAWRFGLTKFYEYHTTILLATLLVFIKLPFIYIAHTKYVFSQKPALAILLASLAGSGVYAALLKALYWWGKTQTFSHSVLLIDWGLSTSLILTVHYLANHRQAASEASPKIWLEQIRYLWPYFGLLAAALALYMGLNQIFFGTPSPVSGQIKHWWGSFITIYGHLPDTIPAILGLSAENPAPLFTLWQKILPRFQSYAWALALSVLALLWLLAQKERSWFERTSRGFLFLPLTVGSFWHIWYYTIQPYVGIRKWYWISETLLSVLLLAFLLDGLIRFIPRLHVRQILRYGILFLLGLWLLVSFGHSSKTLLTRIDYNFWERVQFLEENTEPGAKIGMTGGGVTGYFIQERTIVNLDGLINSSEYMRQLQTFSADHYLNRIGLAYVFGKEGILFEHDPYQRFLPEHLISLATWNKWTLYRYQAIP